MSEQAFQIGTQIKLNDNWIMTGEEYEEGVYWPSTGDIGQVREIDEDQLWVEFPNLEGVWPVEFYIADIVKPMAEELAALETIVYTVQCRCGYDAHVHQNGECPGDGLELTASTLPLPSREPDEYDRLDALKERYYDQRLEAWERQQNFPDYKDWLENMVLRLEDARAKETIPSNPYTVNTPRVELLEQLYQLLHQNDILYSIEDDLLNEGDTNADSLKVWAELNVLRTALQEGEPVITDDPFAPIDPTYPTPYAALAFHILNAKVAVLPEETWNNDWTPGQTVNELASEIERLQSALDQERADNVTLRSELQARRNILDTAQKYRAELYPKDLDNSWTGAIDRLAQGVRDERKWSKYLASKVKRHQQVADGLRTCKVCRDRETTRGDGVCEACYQQWLIDES